MSTKIEWAEDVWNPIRAHRDQSTDAEYSDRRGMELLGVSGWHCERVSEGCQNCYAATINRQQFGTGLDYVRSSREKVEVVLDEKTLLAPLTRRKPTRYFVCSMTDMFGEWVPDEMIDRMFAVMALSQQHTFIVLTKRAERMREYGIPRFAFDGGLEIDEAVEKICGERGWCAPVPVTLPLANVWLGVSAENQARADDRIPELLATPAAVRFVSAEPLLGPVALTQWLHDSDCNDVRLRDEFRKVPHAYRMCICNEPREDHVAWVIVGGESGPNARPCNVEWVRDIVRQCQAAGVAVFVKQMGARPRIHHLDLRAHPFGNDWAVDLTTPDDGTNPPLASHHVEPDWWRPVLRSRKGGDPSEWPEDLRVRQFPEVGR